MFCLKVDLCSCSTTQYMDDGLESLQVADIVCLILGEYHQISLTHPFDQTFYVLLCELKYIYLNAKFSLLSQLKLCSAQANQLPETFES